MGVNIESNLDIVVNISESNLDSLSIHLFIEGNLVKIVKRHVWRKNQYAMKFIGTNVSYLEYRAH